LDRPLKILVTNTTVLNGGSAAEMIAMRETFRRVFGPETRLTLCDQHAPAAARYYPELELRNAPYLNLRSRGKGDRRGRLGRARYRLGAWCWRVGLRFLARLLLGPAEQSDVAEYASADLIVSGPGSYLLEHYGLAPRFFDFRLSLLMRRPLVLFTQSMGPFTQRENVRAMSRILDRASLVLLRGDTSLEHVRSLGVDGEKVHIAADPAFALASPPRREPEKRDGSSPLRVAISVCDWRHFETMDRRAGRARILATFRALTEHLAESINARITFVSTCQGIPEYRDDSEYALQVVEGISDRARGSVTVDRDFRRPEALCELLGAHDLAIGMRMHMAILALVAGTPALPIVCEFKSAEAFRGLDVARFARHVEEVDEGSVLELVDSFIASLDEIARSVPDQVASERDSVVRSAELVKEVYLGSVNREGQRASGQTSAA
jgi:colanic acid/amylovoran biosynthesis protein